MATQLRDKNGNPIIPKVPIPSTMPASGVSIAAGTGLSSTNAQAGFKELKDMIDQSGGGGGETSPYMDVAIGDLMVFGNETSEKNASPVINDKDNYYVASVSVPRIAESKCKRNIVMANHDDMPPCDYLATRKIYNKFGFKAHFCWIFMPWTSASDRDTKIANIRKMVADGQEIGLHAVMNGSYWRHNPMYDVRPDGTSTFGYSLSEIQTDAGDGKNVFGIALTGKLSNIYTSLDDSLKSISIANATAQNIQDANQGYCHYSDSSLVTGIDLEGNSHTWTNMHWIEYFYNELIDNTLGYSSDANTIAARFAEDYVGTYPTSAQLLNGNISSCGHFTKGLYKGCVSTCNYEVVDRCIEIAIAFARRFYNVGRLSDAHRHGVRYILPTYIYNGINYCNREHTVVAGGAGVVYPSRLGAWITVRDIFAKYGILSVVQDGARQYHVVEGQNNFFFGQHGVTNISGIARDDNNGFVGFPNLFYNEGQAESVNYTDYSEFQNYLLGIENYAKFFYENAGNTVTRNGITKVVGTMYRSIIETIRGAVGTGSVAKICVDTIYQNPNFMLCWDMILRFIKHIGYEAVGAKEALAICESTPRGTVGNLFPNPSFNQSVLDYIGGSSSSNRAYVPDGWQIASLSNQAVLSVTNETIGNSTYRVLTSTGLGTLVTSAWGLPQGRYKLSFKMKSTDTSSHVTVCKPTNGYVGNVLYESGETITIYTQEITTADVWVDYEVEFEIPAPHQNRIDLTDAISSLCEGYEDNVTRIVIKLRSKNGVTIKFADPKIIAL